MFVPNQPQASRSPLFSKLGFVAFAIAVMIANGAQAAIRFVDINSPGPTHNGTTWTFAYTSLATALTAASSGDELWVAGGTYKPTTGADRTISFEMKSGVKVFGGFGGFGGGGENLLAQRIIPNNPTILSGDIGVVNNITDNSHHVVHVPAGATGITLDGFIITRGNANSGVFPGTFGGGMYAQGPLTVRNCKFVGNIASAAAGGVAALSAAGTSHFTNCVFSGNSAGGAAGLQCQNHSINIRNCTLSGNTGQGMQFINVPAVSTVQNTILWGNTGASGTLQDKQVTVGGTSSVTFTNNCIEGLSGSLGGSGNTGADPRLVDPNGADNIIGTADDDLHVRNGSSCVDAGFNSGIPTDADDIDDDGNVAEPLPFDADGEPRKRNDLVTDTGSGTAPLVDIGAYEFERTTRTILVNDNATGANNGTTWIDAYTDLQFALGELGDLKFGGPGEIWMAAGTYKPSVPAGRDATFSMVGAAEIYGGFVGNGSEGSRSQRNPDLNRTILSGDIGTVNNSADNAYHVITANGSVLFGAAAVLDGVVITGGNANGTGAANSGGGIFCRLQTANDPVFRNCLLVGNNAVNNGGGAFCDFSDASFVNCVLSGNTATVGGGISLLNASAPKVINCTITNNTVTANSSGGLNSGGSGFNGQIVNSVLAGNIGALGPGTQAAQILLPFGTIDYSSVQGLTGSLGGIGNINATPSFLDANGADNIFGTPDDDYHLLSCSPVIDAGNSFMLVVDSDDIDDDGNTSEALPLDRAAATRITDDTAMPNSGAANASGTVDMGAYEFHGPSGDPCAADCAPAGGNNFVNVDDLLVVINSWGVCSGCAADISPPCGNGAVNVDDLLAVINSWGPCP